MARGAAVARVDRFAASGIAGENFRHNIAKAANVSGDAGDFLLRQIPGLRHIRRDTVLDDGLERFIVRSLNELWLAKRRAAAAAAVDAVAKSAVTFEDELACGRIRLRRSLRR